MEPPLKFVKGDATSPQAKHRTTSGLARPGLG